MLQHILVLIIFVVVTFHSIDCEIRPPTRYEKVAKETFDSFVGDGSNPLPTSDQLKWSKHEIGMLIHFDIATYLNTSYDGCPTPDFDPPDISMFDPKLLNTDQWVDAIKAINASYAVLVVKHNCGFTLFPTSAVVPSTGKPYAYDVSHSPIAGTDIAKNFVDSCRRAGIKTGFYYSIVSNLYCHVSNGQVQPASKLRPGMLNVTQDDYNKIVLFQLRELWTNYGPLEEIWFDGGYTAELQNELEVMLQELQPDANVFNGAGVTPNPIKWICTESGSAPDPTWSTGTTCAGDPTSPDWAPAECDTTLQDFDRWFYGEGIPLRSLSELAQVYHNSVGHNCQMVMDLTPNRDGLIAANHMARYRQLGNFIRSCYAMPVQNVSVTNATSSSIMLHYDHPASVDRVVIQEDQSYGQRIRSYVVNGLLTDGITWQKLSSGQSVGNKKIDLFKQPLLVNAIQLLIQQSVPTTPNVKFFAAYVCDSFDDDQ